MATNLISLIFHSFHSWGLIFPKHCAFWALLAGSEWVREKSQCSSSEGIRERLWCKDGSTSASAYTWSSFCGEEHDLCKVRDHTQELIQWGSSYLATISPLKVPTKTLSWGSLTQPSDNLAKEHILQITCKQVRDPNCFMWLILSEKALCKQLLWLKTTIICQLLHATQWTTSVPHFCHLSHIAMACVTHWQNSKGWEVWLWSW